jgi:hypothetical protein
MIQTRAHIQLKARMPSVELCLFDFSEAAGYHRRIRGRVESAADRTAVASASGSTRPIVLKNY